ncbi:hypothetical protein GE061_002643 [Apolygus lucorum]|uniref:SIFamide n=1 Tax=Apolygus lucorum TaxID=248454 RepID=A0A8S9X5M1_APOLU|nr:hypothetical protein GE061_002643 [Apolygus lucorum]
MSRFLVASCLMVVLVLLILDVSFAYKKPPFNGSIFGKRTGPPEYEQAGKALSTIQQLSPRHFYHGYSKTPCFLRYLCKSYK